MKCGFYSPETHSLGGDHMDLHEETNVELEETVKVHRKLKE